MLPLRKDSGDDRLGETPSMAENSADPDGGFRPRLLPFPQRADVLNRLTIGHVVLGFLRFRAKYVSAADARPATHHLDREAFMALEALQHQFDLGRIDREQFAACVERTIGDPARNVAFAGLGFWGSAVPCAPRHRYSRILRMTPTQRKQARGLYRDLHKTIATLRLNAHDRVCACLSAPQMARLEDARSALRYSDVQSAPRTFSEALQEECELAGNQQAHVAVTCALLRTAVAAEHDRARVRFIRALRIEQCRLLEVIESVPPLGSKAD